MSKYYYITIGAIAAVLLVALTILSYVDRSFLYPAKAPAERTERRSPAASREGRVREMALPSPAPPRAPADGSKPTPAPLKLRLIATTVFDDKSTAIIEETAWGSRGVYRLGDRIKEFTITSILLDSVTLTSPDRTVVLTRDAGVDQGPGSSFFTKLDDSSWLVSSDKVSDMVSNIDQYVGQVIAFQHREQGEPAGFTIRHLKEGNDFEQLGIKNNDIIKRVNGLELNDLTDVVKAVYQLGNETSFSIEVERDSQMKTLNYNLDGNVNALVPLISRMLNISMGDTGVQ